MNHQFGWDLPPGANSRDIDRAGEAECDTCGGAGLVPEIIGGVSTGQEIRCPDCDGEGVVAAKAREEIAEERADDERGDV